MNKTVRVPAEEIVVSYTQVYDSLPLVASHLTLQAAYQLMLFILSRLNTDDKNLFTSDSSLYDDFHKTYGVGRNSFDKALKQLKDVGVIIPQEKRGHYLFNPHLAWKGDTKERIEWIRNNVNTSTAKNPVK